MSSPETCFNWPECCCSGECGEDKRRSRWGALLIVGLCLFTWAIVLAAIWSLLLIVKAEAHDAIPTAAQPLGWSYPMSCCSGYDCRQVKAKVKETPQGYIVPSGEVIAMTDPRIKDSPDGEFHWCSQGGTDDGKTICLFVPSRGF